MRGIYVDAADDIDGTVLAHAVRIARCLYPRAYLSAASAVLLGPTPDGRLFLSGQRTQRTRIRALEIIQNKAPPHPSVASAVIADSLGEFSSPVSAANADTLRLSGVQIKAPMSLDADGRLSPSVRLPFTHILKPAGTSGSEALPLIEWVGLSLARGIGLPVPDAALVPMPDGMPPALLVERFDIRDRADDTRLLAMEDTCSVLDLEPHDKYTGTIERVARATRALSTAPDDDLLMLLRRVLFAWLVADGDMHLKNMALLKTARAGETAFSAVRLAPVYDALTTRVFPGLEHDRMALKLAGKDERLRREDFLALAVLAGVRASDANATIDHILSQFPLALDAIALPDTRGKVARPLSGARRCLRLGARVASPGFITGGLPHRATR